MTRLLRSIPPGPATDDSWRSIRTGRQREDWLVRSAVGWQRQGRQHCGTGRGRIASPDWSMDNKHIIYEDGGDLWTVPMTGDRKPSVFLKTTSANGSPSSRPTAGGWPTVRTVPAATKSTSDPFPPGDTVHPVSRDGGWAPRWRRDGKELFFLSLDSTMMAVSIDPATGTTWACRASCFTTGFRPGEQTDPMT